MYSRIVTFFLFILFICSMTTFGQTTAQVTDKGAPYVVNPNPDPIVNNIDVIMEETFGSNANVYGPAGLRGRGNIFHCTNPRKLIEHRMYLNPTSAATMYFLVYEGATFTGTYDLVSSVNLTGQGPGEGWYSSGAIDYDLQNGMFYLIYAQWDVNANYYNAQGVTPYPVPCSFGEQYAGIGWNWVPVYSDPPPSQQLPTELENEGVSYYQVIVTDDIVPVELTSFTFNVSGNNINLNWQTASEKNNQGFQVQRKTTGSFQTIGFINGAGTTTKSQSYSYSDRNLEPGTYTYRLNQVDFDGTTYASEELSIIIDKPVTYTLEQNYPNPFNPTTQINYSVAERGNVSLVVYDLLGKEVANLVNEVKEPGSYQVNFNASNLPSGIYAYRIQSGNFVQTKKMMLIK